MVTNRLQGSRSPKRAPVAADSANGTLLRFQEQYCGHRCHAPATAGGESALVGPLALTLGASAAATDDAQAAQVMPLVLRGSHYLGPAQELLRDAVSLGREAPGDENEGGYDDEEAGDDARLEMLATSRRIHGKNDDGGVQAKLLGLLSELESRQEHYFQELSRVAASFEPALGPAATAGYTSLMSQAMSRHFSNLRRAILRKLAALTMPPAPTRATLWADEDSEEEDEDEEDYDYDPARAAVTEEDMVNRLVRRTKRAAAARAAEQVCNPLRGLPEDSVAVLRAWLFDHFLDPYPSDNEKLRLAVSTGLSRRQISNWFINARVRLWKPMIEEMYNDEFSHDFAVVSRDGGGASSS